MYVARYEGSNIAADATRIDVTQTRGKSAAKRVARDQAIRFGTNG